MSVGAPYLVKVRGRPRRALLSLPPKETDAIRGALAQLANIPRPPGVIKVEGTDLWRIRVGEYRVTYSVDDAAREVLVVRIGHRRDVYRNLQSL